MREKIAKIVTRTHRTDSSWLFLGEATDQIHKEYMDWFREEIEKLRVMEDEEIDKAYVNGWLERNTEVDSPLHLKQIGEDSGELDVLKELTQAQLTKTKEDLRKVME